MLWAGKIHVIRPNGTVDSEPWANVNLMCENHGRGMLALRIKRSSPARLLNLTPISPSCTIDVIQTRDGSIVFSDAGAIYRLVPG